ncbi:MAG: hypothetical protein HOK71_21560 [Planctomycetaceae bacterium]|nr:hypothetical protein [Planctomycetaceae bacterium]MBT6487245.1 hypothetical protein [Planctomycetaceae bacterium]
MRIGVAVVAIATAVVIAVTTQPVKTKAGKFRNPFRRKTSIERLAEQIDKLEHEIDEYGSVVAKQPDVWGEARLTKHRQEFEEVMAKEKDNFKFTINAAISRSDQAFLANALALQAAATGSTGTGDESVSTTTTTNLVSGVDDVIARDKLLTRFVPKTVVAPDGEAVKGIALEPTIVLDQQARYLNHLHELRRISEGDDTADSPGYALNLVRIPVSVLPGDQTRQGHGAEITITATPYLSDELLLQTFRSLVINDLLDELTLPIVKLTDEIDGSQSETNLRPPAKAQDARLNRDMIKMLHTMKSGDDFFDRAANAVNKVVASPLTVSRSRRARKPLPSSQRGTVYGVTRLLEIALAVKEQNEGDSTARIHNLDVQEFLKDELMAAYDFLYSPKNVHLWNHVDGLSDVIRSGGPKALSDRQTAFDSSLPEQSSNTDNEDPYRIAKDLAWCILVESALLDAQMHDDMKRVAADKGCSCAVPVQYPLYTPEPPPEAVQAFKEYVKCRWPIHVFAIDPVTQDQNVADAFSRRRETQLALSLAFASGKMNAQNFTRFARRIELDMETIALNRTVVGFSHGEDTFGWRFYPRVQTPEIEGNLTVAVRDLLIGGMPRDRDIKQRRLEPGTRECVAVVIMPSFVPYLTFDIRSNWFELTDPEDKEFDLQDTVEMSRTIRKLKDAEAVCLQEEQLYRFGEVQRLSRAVDQLEKRLPLQSTQVQIPLENTLGGFQMVSNGVTDLGPELIGFYGEPGIDQTKDTVLFLVGDNFSVHETKVVAGGKDVKPTLLSRQVIQVKIPKGTTTIDQKKNGGKFIDVHVATPYGVSTHLKIPVFKSAKPSSASSTTGFKWSPETVVMHHGYDAAGLFTSALFELTEPKLEITAPSGTRAVTGELEITLATKKLKVDGTDIDPKISKFTLKGLKFEKGKFVIKGSTYIVLGVTLNQIFKQTFVKSKRPAEDVEMTAVLKIDGSTEKIKLDNKLTIDLDER